MLQIAMLELLLDGQLLIDPMFQARLSRRKFAVTSCPCPHVSARNLNMRTESIRGRISELQLLPNVHELRAPDLDFGENTPMAGNRMITGVDPPRGRAGFGHVCGRR